MAYGMVHARIVRSAELRRAIDRMRYITIEKMPGVVKVVRDGNFSGVVANKEFQDQGDARAVGCREMRETASLPKQTSLLRVLTSSCPSPGTPDLQHSRSHSVGAKNIEATYYAAISVARFDRTVCASRNPQVTS